jgi:hypothetical protein
MLMKGMMKGVTTMKRRRATTLAGHPPCGLPLLSYINPSLSSI